MALADVDLRRREGRGAKAHTWGEPQNQNRGSERVLPRRVGSVSGVQAVGGIGWGVAAVGAGAKPAGRSPCPWRCAAA
eukprot:3938142-Prymnesium_polylepis.1